MIEFQLTPPLAWLATYLAHSTALIGLVWLLERAEVLRQPRLREFAWRLAIVGGLLTASVQTFAPEMSLVEFPEMPAATSATTMPAQIAVPDTVADTSDSMRDARGAWPTSPTRSQPAAPTFRFDLLLTGVWAGGAALLLIRLAVAAFFARRELRDRRPLASGELHERLLVLCRQDDARPAPRLSASPRLAGPVTLPSGEICVPEWAQHALSRASVDAMLAHELAHVRRRDPLVLFGITLIASLLFLQPLNRLAHRRLGALAEFNADAFAARLCGNPRALAQALAECAERLNRFPTLTDACGVAMATRRSPLVQRVERLLGDQIMNDNRVPPLARIAGAGLLGAVVALLPAIGTPVEAAGTSRHVSVREHNGDAEMRLEIGKPGYFLHVETDGRVRFNDAENDIAELEEGGSILIREKRDGVLHELEIENDNGELEREYARDDKTMSMDDQAHAWLGRVIPEVLRNTAVNAEERIARIHARDGNRGVLNELKMIESDHALAKYAVLFASKYPLNPDEIDELLKRLKTVGSDFELRNALATVITNHSLEADTQARLLEVGATIGSDFESAELAATVIGKLEPTSKNLAAWRKVVADIGSDFEMRRALSPVFERDLPRAWQLAALEVAADGIGSDFEMRSLLEAAAPRATDAELVQRYIKGLRTVGSDFEAREAVVVLARQGQLDADGYSRLLDAVDDIGADFETAQALIAIAPRMPRDDRLLQKYHRLAGELADHERQQAERALD